MKFLLQKDVLLDFVFGLQKAKEFWDWYRPSCFDIEFVDSGCSKEICPVGSLEFCLDYYKKLGIELHPLNVPEVLFPWAIGYGKGSRKIENVNDWIDTLVANSKKLGIPDATREKVLKAKCGDGFYIKSETKFKDPGNGFYKTIEEFLESGHCDLKDKYQMTMYDPGISDEWRYFVLDGKVVGMQRYNAGDILRPIIPPSWKILDWIKKIDLRAFTLDVASFQYGTKVVEVHDFFSCGLYGFSDYKTLPYMFYRSHLQKFL